MLQSVFNFVTAYRPSIGSWMHPVTREKSTDSLRSCAYLANLGVLALVQPDLRFMRACHRVFTLLTP